MKKFILSITTITTLVSNLYAQQTITGTSAIGFSVNFAIATAATASTVPIGNTGANAVWNCANLQTSNPVLTLSVSAPSGQPFTNDYPASNWNLNASMQGTLFVNEFFILNNDSLVKLGGHISGSPYEIYNNPQIDMKFPFNLNDVFVDTYAKTSYQANGSVSSSQTGSVTLSYEGYGTLILPVGTFTNVALLKRVRTNSIGPTTTSYSWVKYPSGERLMEYDTNGGIKVNYANSIVTTGLNSKTSVTQLSLYPTFTDGIITIHGLNDSLNVKVYNTSGKSIPFTLSGTSSIKLENEPGIYFIEISDLNGAKCVFKIVLN